MMMNVERDWLDSKDVAEEALPWVAIKESLHVRCMGMSTHVNLLLLVIRKVLINELLAI
jgi:hypothetical protein